MENSLSFLCDIFLLCSRPCQPTLDERVLHNWMADGCRSCVSQIITRITAISLPSLHWTEYQHVLCWCNSANYALRQFQESMRATFQQEDRTLYLQSYNVRHPYTNLKLVSEIREQYLYQQTEGVIEWKSKWRGTSKLLIFFHSVLVDYINENCMKKLCTACGISRRIGKKSIGNTKYGRKIWKLRHRRYAMERNV
jgi:hypothetical protein